MKKEDEELWAPYLQYSKESKHFPGIFSEFPKPDVVSRLEQGETPGMADRPVLEENGIASDSSTGFPDVIIKLEQEEEPLGIPHHQMSKRNESIPGSLSAGNQLLSKNGEDNLHLHLSEGADPNGTSPEKELISKCVVEVSPDGAERQQRICPETSGENIPLWREDKMAHDETEVCQRILKCGQVFLGDSNLPVHVKEKLHTCTGSRESFSLQPSLARHQRIHSGEKGGNPPHDANRLNQNPALQVQDGTPTGKGPYICYVCGKSFRNKAHFIIHERTHTGEKPFKCHDCGKSFRNTSHLILHKRTHTGEKPYKCSACGKSFNQSSNLIRHERTHTGEKPYPCSVCGKSFSWGPELQIHERIHTGEKPYKCLDCEKCFNNYSSFIRHKRIHTGEKPYQCATCSRSFHQSSDLREHERSRHQQRKADFWEGSGSPPGLTEEEAKSYQCAACGKRFSQRSHLTRHEGTHIAEKPYKCSECGKSFNQTSNLIRHERTHTGEKPYQCPSCDRSFNRKSHLLRHEGTHAGEMPFGCSESEKSFSRRSSLARHEKSHSEEKSCVASQCGENFAVCQGDLGDKEMGTSSD